MKVTSPVSDGRTPERRESSGEQRLHLIVDKRSSAGCAAGPESVNRWSATIRPLGLVEKRKSGSAWETMYGPRYRRKALKSEAQERGKLKDASEGEGTDAAERVAKPCERYLWRARQRPSNAWQTPAQKGVPGPDHAEG